MGSAPSPPPAPDPNVVSAAQAKANKETAIAQQELNFNDQYSPVGSLKYNKIGTYEDGTPKFEATTSLNPNIQSLLDRNISELNKPFNLNDAINTQYQDMTGKLLDPVWNQRQSSLETKLQNQGIAPGSEAYTNAMRDFSNQRDTSYSQLQLAGRSQAEQEALAQRSLPLGELSSLISGSQPTFAGTPQTGVAQTDVTGAYGMQTAANNANYQAQVANNNAMMGGLFGIPAAALGGWGMSGFAGASALLPALAAV